MFRRSRLQCFATIQHEPGRRRFGGIQLQPVRRLQTGGVSLTLAMQHHQNVQWIGPHSFYMLTGVALPTAWHHSPTETVGVHAHPWMFILT